MRLVAGLGNPGGQYAGHRHNIGFMVADRLAEAYGFSNFRGRFDGEVADGVIAGEKIALLKPQTMMNLSGQSVGAALRFFKLQPENLVVIHDELDLAPGKVRVKCGGGAGGHDGLRDIDRVIGREYWRVRIGIGHPGDKGRVTGHVLRNFDEAEALWRDAVIDAVARHFPLMVTGDAERFMTDVARDTRQALADYAARQVDDREQEN